MTTAWDDFDAQGREHRRIQRIALAQLKRLSIEAQGGAVDDKSFEAWSLVHARHSEMILRLMQFERQVMLDTKGRHTDTYTRSRDGAVTR